MGAITIKILAEKLNLSRSTVSKALSDSHEISSETKNRILALAAEMGYTLNPYASSLRKKSSKTIAVVLPEVTDSFFAQAINGIEFAAQDNGYHVLIYLTHERFEKEASIMKDIQNGRIDGVLISVSAETAGCAHLQELCNKGIPLVFFDRICEEVKTAKVTTNDYESGYNATQHLIDCGCRKISFFAISKNLLITRQRIKGYIQALTDNNIRHKPHILACGNDMQYHYAAIKKLLEKKSRPDGIVSSVEKLAISVYTVCNELKISIPGLLKVICFTNLQTAPLLQPPLTTITQPAFEMGKTAAIVLFKALKKKNLNDLHKESTVIKSVLMVRNSTVPGSAFR
jgi:LacI family transcriptional regulator